MPIFIRFVETVKGDVAAAGGATGGVWKTTNFLTNDPAGRTASSQGVGSVGALQNVGGTNTWMANALPVSRISLVAGGGGVEGRDPAVKPKLDQLVRAAKRQGPTGKLYVATDNGVYRASGSRRADGQGRLIFGSDQGVWRSGGANRLNHSNNLKQIGLASLNAVAVEIIVTDTRGSVVGLHRLSGASVSGSSGTFTLTFKGQTTGGL